MLRGTTIRSEVVSLKEVCKDEQALGQWYLLKKICYRFWQGEKDSLSSSSPID